MYIDESGSDSINDEEIWYVLAGVIVSEVDWKEINSKVDKLKRELFPSGNIEKIELHAHAIRKKKGILSQFDYERVKEILRKLYELIQSLPVTIIAVAINKQELILNNSNREPLTDAWTFLIERFDKFVEKTFTRDGRVNLGLLVKDERMNSADNYVRDLLKSFGLHGTGFQSIRNVIEDPVFSPSHLNNIIQLADAVAYCVFRRIKNDGEFVSYFKTIKDNFDKRPDGEILKYGLKIFPETTPCFITNH